MKNKFSQVKRSDEFSKELKKLVRKYRSLEDDLQTFIEAQLFPLHKLQIDNGGVFPIDDLGIEEFQILKAKKFACKALKGRGVNSGIRIIYAYLPEQDEIFLIEIYFKGDKEIEDRQRIKNFLQNFSR